MSTKQKLPPKDVQTMLSKLKSEIMANGSLFSAPSSDYNRAIFKAAGLVESYSKGAALHQFCAGNWTGESFE